MWELAIRESPSQTWPPAGLGVADIQLVDEREDETSMMRFSAMVEEFCATTLAKFVALSKPLEGAALSLKTECARYRSQHLRASSWQHGTGLSQPVPQGLP